MTGHLIIHLNVTSTGPFILNKCRKTVQSQIKLDTLKYIGSQITSKYILLYFYIVIVSHLRHFPFVTYQCVFVNTVLPIQQNYHSFTPIQIHVYLLYFQRLLLAKFIKITLMQIFKVKLHKNQSKKQPIKFAIFWETCCGNK